MKWVVVFWIIGIFPDGDLGSREYQMVMFEPMFTMESDCVLYSLQAEEIYFRELTDKIRNNTNYVDFDLVTEPECKQLDTENMELIDNGPDI
jgi:hypothetical protein